MRRKRKHKKSHSVPRVKRMNRARRLQSAKSWLKKYGGKNVLRGYCRHFGVDWRCAAVELEKLGVKIDPEYLQQREVTERELAAARRRRREEPEHLEAWPPYQSALECFLAEDYPALHAWACERDQSELDSQSGA